jgi:L-fuconolactonase
MIDSHVHFWKFDPIRDSWITDEMRAIQRDFLPEDFIDATTTSQITGCIAVQADQTEAQNDFLLALAESNEVIKGIVGWVDLLNPELEERLTYWKKFSLIKGWRHVLQSESKDFILAPELINGIKKLKNYDYTYDLLCFHHQLPEIINLVNQIPDQSLVLDHCGKPDIKSRAIENWKEHIKILAQNPNVYCKISGLLTEADWNNWSEKEIFDCFDVVFDSFGANRIMYGSDWPVLNLSRPYPIWFDLVSKYLSRLDGLERNKVMFKNAIAFYKIKPKYENVVMQQL